ncbi:AIR synthase-related protein [Archaeoglobus veneficus]|uniref:AIR synthase related protein domain protein n=1 Tax=Archaeoglobus veneficus (strain DSM 11195 / SNP6) TaxID=693661 RepID=F2KMP1_ARCVS|nr:AIR synthase-related protein [Archaeoglobus veneficus]AEA47238.1 AIR synthase related protein domain protein [Archaeoglobus veneficus SNP6]
MDIEGYARRMLERGIAEDEVRKKLAERIAEIKGWSLEKAAKWAEAVVLEVKNAYSKTNYILEYWKSGVTMGEFGVGSRGKGDFYVHSKIAEVIGKSGEAIISSKDLDDAGVIFKNVKDGIYISVAVDGIHSRLSEFPFIAGFHVTRAAMRDVYVMGTEPVAVFSDIHIADDGDVSKIFDHIAGISAVCELTGVPLVAGSTLRIGGDMVIGERMTGCVGCVGIGSSITARKNARPGDIILLTEGAGGGTIATTAIYYGMHEVVEETLNIDFIKACKAIFSANLVPELHTMSDVTNGGIRGDAEEISKVSGCSLVFDMEKVRSIVNPRVLNMLESLEIDFMGVSIDSLMVICPPETAKEVMNVVRSAGIKIEEVGWVEEGKGAYVIEDGEVKPIRPRFRESAYTPLKKVVGEEEPRDFEEMRRRVDEAVLKAIEKKRHVVEMIKKRMNA